MPSGIQLSAGILTGTNKPVDSKFGPYASVSEALADLSAALRYRGLTVGIISGSAIVEYWFSAGVADSDFIVKASGSGGSGVTSFSAGTTGLAPSTATSGAVTLSGTLALANGGTGSTTAAGARTNLGVAATSHTHGNITNAGAIGTTAVLPIITGASGVLQAGSFGTTAGTFAQGNDARIASSIASAGTRTITDEQIMTEAEYAAITPNPTTLYFII
jgi:hypothetical protein